MGVQSLNLAAFLKSRHNDGVHTAAGSHSGPLAEANELIANCDAAERPFDLNLHWPACITTSSSKLVVIKKESSGGVLMMSVKFAASGLAEQLISRHSQSVALTCFFFVSIK